MKTLVTTVYSLLFSVVVRAQKPHVSYTDSSRIESRVYASGKEVKETITAKDLVYYRFYRDNQARATTTSTYTKAGRTIGITKEYNDHGKLLYSIDYDHGLWLVANAIVDPYYALRQQMKAKADRLIAARYGQYFLIHNVVWNVGTSAIYNSESGGNWTDVFGEKPDKFLFRYDVKLDSRHVYPELIEFALDAQGNFMTDDFEEVYGFEQVVPYPVKGFGLGYGTALEIARKKSGVKGEPLTGFLKWEKVKSPFLYTYGLYAGQFRFYVPVKTSVLKDIHPKGRSRVTVYYDVYSFNPWTGVLLGKKLMETVQEWEENSGFNSGLVPRR